MSRLLAPKALFVLVEGLLNKDVVFVPVPVLNKLVVGAGFRLNPVLG